MPSVAEWDSIYNKTLEMISKVRGTLDLRGGVKDFSKVQAMLNIIANSINKMQNDLDTMSGDTAKYKLNDREIKRRQNMIEGLKREKTNCDTNFEKNGGNLQAKNRLITHANYDAENLTKQTDADLHNMQEQVFAGT